MTAAIERVLNAPALKVGHRPGAVLVTGASSGIGRAVVVELASRGVSVFAGVRRPGDAPQGTGLPGPVYEVLLDVTDPDQISAAVESIRGSLGGRCLAGVVNSAGIAVGGPMEYVTLDEMRDQFEVNLFGPLAVTQAVLELIRPHGNGRVVFVSSIGSHVAAPFFGPYAASKRALNGMAEAMRRELHPWNIHVSVLVPGAVATPIWDKADETAQSLMDNLSERGMELYGSALQRVRRYISATAAGRSIPPAAVVRAACHALYAPRPRAVYVIGAEARVGVTLSAALPVRVFDMLLARKLS